MAVKPVINIDINDERFKRFKELYDKFHAQVDKLPNAWGKVGDKQTEIGKGLEAMTAALLAQLELSRKSDDEDEKRVKRLDLSEKLWTSIKNSALSTERSLIAIGRDLLSVSGIFGLATGASLFGLDRLGAATGDARRSASGLGLSIGQQRAFANSFSRFVDPNAFLSGISTAQSDLSKQSSLYSIGVNPNQGAADLAVDTLKRVREMAQQTPLNQLGILESSRHLDQLGIGVEDLRRLKGTSDTEFNRQLGSYKSGIANQGISDDVAERWQTFVQKLEAAGNEIQKVLVDALVPLTGPLENLSHSIVELIARISKNDSLKEGIDKFAHWIDSLSGTVSKPEFLTSIDTFVTDIGKVSEALHALSWLFTNPSEEESKPFLQDQDNRWNSVKGFFGRIFGGGPDTSYFKDLITGAAGQNHANAALALAIAQNESSLGQHMDTQQGGATGLFQIKPVWSKAFKEDPNDPRQAADMGTKIAAYLDRKYHDLGKDLAAYNLGETMFDKLTHGGQDKNWRSEIPAAAQAYVAKGERIILQINNNTGGSVTVAAQQVAPN